MHLVWHQAISPDLNASRITPFAHQAQTGFVIFIIEVQRKPWQE